MDKLCELDVFLFNSLSSARKESFMKSMLKSQESKRVGFIQSFEDFEKDCINKINHDSAYSLGDKLGVTQMILSRVEEFQFLSQEFFEEECHLSLVNWIWKELKCMKKSKDLPDEISFYTFLQLIYNIIFILQNLQFLVQVFPIIKKVAVSFA